MVVGEVSEGQRYCYLIGLAFDKSPKLNLLDELLAVQLDVVNQTLDLLPIEAYEDWRGCGFRAFNKIAHILPS